MTGKVSLVSRRSGAHGKTADNDSNLPSISANGHYIAYGTASDNLPVGRGLIVGGVFARDLRTETNRLISGVPGIDYWVPSSFSPDISGNGRRVAFGFQYSPTPIDPQASDDAIFKLLHHRHKQIMLADPGWNRPMVVSRASGPGATIANSNCREASVSGSGRFVAFTSSATNLVADDDNGVEDVFIRDVRLGLTTLVSRINRNGPEGNGNSGRPSISADGRFVAFQSRADNLMPGDGDDEPDVFVKDLQTGQLILASRGLAGEFSNGKSAVPAISTSGRFVAFASTASNLSPENGSHDLAFYRFQLPH